MHWLLGASLLGTRAHAWARRQSLTLIPLGSRLDEPLDQPRMVRPRQPDVDAGQRRRLLGGARPGGRRPRPPGGPHRVAGPQRRQPATSGHAARSGRSPGAQLAARIGDQVGAAVAAAGVTGDALRTGDADSAGVRHPCDACWVCSLPADVLVWSLVSGVDHVSNCICIHYTDTGHNLNAVQVSWEGNANSGGGPLECAKELVHFVEMH